MNSKSSNYFKSWLNEFFKPIILIYCSNKIREIFKKNNLKPAEYLRLIGDFSGMNLKIPFNEGTNSIINDFKFDFIDNINFTKLKSSQKEEMYKICMNYNKPKWTLNSPIINKNNLDIINNKIKFFSFPWYIEFQKLFLECMTINEYDFYYQPLITVYMCAIDEDYNNIIIDEPDLIKDEIYRRTNNNVLIVLCDKNNEENKKIDENAFKEIKYKFESNYKDKFHIIFNDINSLDENNNNNDNNINWMNYFHKTELYDNYNDYRRNKEKKIVFGNLISNDDINNLRMKFFNYIQDVYLTNINDLIEKNSKQNNEKFFGFFSKNKNEYNNKYPQIIKLNNNNFESLFISLNYFFFRNYSSSYKKLKDLKGRLFKNPNNNIQLQNFHDFYYINRYFGKEKKKQNFLNDYKMYTQISNFNIKEFIRWFFILTAMFEDYLNIENPSKLIELIKDKVGNILLNFNKVLNSRMKNNDKTNSNSLNLYIILYPLIIEKIICYFSCAYKYRKFIFYSVYVGFIYKKMNNQILNEYAFYNFGNSILFSNQITNSFLNLRLNINNILGEISNELNYIEGGFIFFKNCLELSVYNKNLINNQSMFMTFYLNNKKKLIEKDNIKNNNNNNSNILNIFRLNLPEIDNKSIFITEQIDYEIEFFSKNKNYINVKWDCFNKYIELFKSKPYCNLNEKDLLILKNINNVILQKENSSNFHMRREFYGNVNDNLYIKFKIINPLNIEIPINSIKLDYIFTPENKSNNNNELENNNNELNIKENEVKIKLNKNSNEIIELCITSLQPGQIYIKGVELNLYDNCKLYHSFNLKDKSRLYQHKNKLFFSEEYEKRRRKSSSNSSNSSNKDNLSNNSKIYLAPVSKKTKLIYNIKSIDEDIYIKIPMGKELNLFKYQFILFPIELINNSKNHRIKKFTIFFNDSIKYNNNDNIIKTTLFDYITVNKELFEEDNKTMIFVPIFPQITGEIFIKIVIKFEDELKYKNIEIKRFLVKLNVKPSFEFKIEKEIVNYDNINNELNKIIFNLILNGKNKNENFYLKFEKFFINKFFNILNNNNNNSKIISNKENNKLHYKFIIEQNMKNYVKKNNENINLDFILENKNNNIEYILNKISNILNKSNYLIIEWEYIKNNNNENNNSNLENNNNENNEINNNNNNSENNNINNELNNNDKIKGLYFYDIQIKNRNKITIELIKKILLNSVKMEVNQTKITNEETLVTINLILNKKGFIGFKNILKYEIFIYNDDYRIIWLGVTKFIILNSHTENDIINIDFNFITNYKGCFLIDQIGVLFHEKNKNNFNIINIKNITKPKEININ